jgi:hypothetical protein
LGRPRLRRRIQQRSKLLAGELDPGIPRWRESVRLSIGIAGSLLSTATYQ